MQGLWDAWTDVAKHSHIPILGANLNIFIQRNLPNSIKLTANS
jgi:hypothetical protein